MTYHKRVCSRGPEIRVTLKTMIYLITMKGRKNGNGNEKYLQDLYDHVENRYREHLKLPRVRHRRHSKLNNIQKVTSL